MISRHAILVFATILVFGVGIITGALWLKDQVEDSVLNSYRLVSAGELFLDYKKSTGEWPRNWDSLEQYATTHGSQLYATENFDELKSNIDIDFAIDFQCIDTSAAWSDKNPQLRLFVARTGETQGATSDPNELIYSYLQLESAKTRTEP